jgi:hypothetical protein
MGRPRPSHNKDDCFVLGEVKQRALFARMAGAVHRGRARAGSLAGMVRTDGAIVAAKLLLGTPRK